jgi:lysyl-tRNA synthetase class 2
MGKRIMGKASSGIEDAEGRIQIYVARDDISTDEEKTMYNVVFKTY